MSPLRAATASPERPFSRPLAVLACATCLHVPALSAAEPLPPGEQEVRSPVWNSAEQPDAAKPEQEPEPPSAAGGAAAPETPSASAPGPASAPAAGGAAEPGGRALSERPPEETPPPQAAEPLPVQQPPAQPYLLPSLEPPTAAVVQMASDFPDTRLEIRSAIERGPWQPVCTAPCNRKVQVDGMEVRVAAPGMTTSNSFRIEPGAGVARLRVAGGSKTARAVGIGAFLAGVPVAFGGMTLLGTGLIEDDATLRTGGIVALAVGAAAIAVSLPLLLRGATNVRDAKGSLIATRPGATPAY